MQLKNILASLGIDFSSKNELKKKEIKVLLSKFKAKSKKIKKALKNEKDEKKCKELEEDLKILTTLRKKNIKELKSLILEIKIEKKK